MLNSLLSFLLSILGNSTFSSQQFNNFRIQPLSQERFDQAPLMPAPSNEDTSSFFDFLDFPPQLGIKLHPEDVTRKQTGLSALEQGATPFIA